MCLSEQPSNWAASGGPVPTDVRLRGLPVDVSRGPHSHDEDQQGPRPRSARQPGQSHGRGRSFRRRRIVGAGHRALRREHRRRRGLRAARRRRQPLRRTGRHSGSGQRARQMLGPALTGIDPADQAAVDGALLALDASPRKTALGGNSLLAVIAGRGPLPPRRPDACPCIDTCTPSSAQVDAAARVTGHARADGQYDLRRPARRAATSTSRIS